MKDVGASCGILRAWQAFIRFKTSTTASKQVVRCWHGFQQDGCVAPLLNAENDAGVAQVAELNGEAQAVGRATLLPDDGQVGLALDFSPLFWKNTLGLNDCVH